MVQLGGQRDARIAVLHRWLEAGLDLGNHTYSHPNLGQVPLHRYLDDIVKGEVITRPLLEARRKQLVWFRYPFLATGKDEATARAVEEFLAQRGYRIAPVSVDYHDYTFAGVYSRHLRAGEQAQAGRSVGGIGHCLVHRHKGVSAITDTLERLAQGVGVELVAVDEERLRQLV
ncbi:MAG TPA: polysaccharide deacetylase family protein, partial [Telluria sp.]